jgi:hypothetical protein
MKKIKGLHDSELPFKKKPGQQLLLSVAEKSGSHNHHQQLR